MDATGYVPMLEALFRFGSEVQTRCDIGNSEYSTSENGAGILLRNVGSYQLHRESDTRRQHLLFLHISINVRLYVTLISTNVLLIFQGTSICYPRPRKLRLTAMGVPQR
jgi:hypothetical protein